MVSYKYSPPAPPIPKACNSGEITIRQFSVDDAEQVYALLVEGLVYGADSPRNIALRRSFFRPLGLSAIAALVIGAACLATRTHNARMFGSATCLYAGAVLTYIYHAITAFFLRLCTLARETDMGDIPTAYGMAPVHITNTPAGSGAPGGFWVATTASERVVGCIGLEYRHPDTATVRRMFVSAAHRRRGIARRLLGVAREHARSMHIAARRSEHMATRWSMYIVSVGLTVTLELETSEFQPAAVRLYGRHGFELEGTRVIYLGAFLPMMMLRFSRRVPV